jgi:DHA1 family purine base/nucleoside efflux pump-like MFS transporter
MDLRKFTIFVSPVLIEGGRNIKKPTFLILVSAGFVLSFNVAAASALIPAVASEFRIDEFFAGRIVWLYMLAYGSSALLYGPLARSLDSKKILFPCIAVFSLANLAAALAPNIELLFAARILSGISGAVIIPLALILIAKTFASKERGKRVGAFFSSTFISSLLGLFLSGILFWRWIFLLPALAGALVCWGVWRYFPSIPYEKARIRFDYFKVLGDKTVFRLFIYIFAVSFLYHGVRQWLGVYFFQAYAFNQFLISTLLTTISLSGVFGEAFGGRLSDRLGRVKIVNTGAVLMFAALILLLFKNVLFFLFAIMFIWGLGWTFNHAGISTFLTDLPHKHLYESASLNSSVRFLSGGLGAAFGGVLARWDFNLEFVFFAFCLVLLFVFSKRLIRDFAGPVSGSPSVLAKLQ